MVFHISRMDNRKIPIQGIMRKEVFEIILLEERIANI